MTLKSSYVLELREMYPVRVKFCGRKTNNMKRTTASNRRRVVFLHASERTWDWSVNMVDSADGLSVRQTLL
jgi:hypothetical protein